MNRPVIDIRDCVKGYRTKYVLKHLDLQVPQGSVLGLLGKNGAGKTTLIKCALGLLKPESGTIRVWDDVPLDFSPQSKERIGYVPQSDRPYPWLSVQEILDYTGSFYPRWNRSLVDSLVREFELDPEDRVGILSEGQAQKLAIILALGHEPELLVFDEPVASLDPAARRQFLKKILEIVSDRECTIFFSTHITSDLERVADRVALLKDGQIDFCGELDVLKDEVKRLRITSPLPLATSIQCQGLLHYEVVRHEAILAVRGYGPQLRQEIVQTFGPDIEVEDLNLEEIFLELNR